MMIVFSLLFAILRFTQRAYIIGSKVGLYWLLPFLHSDLYEVSFIVLHISGFFYRRVCGIYLRHENIPMPRQRSNSFGLRSGSSLPSSGASSASSLSRLYWVFRPFVVPRPRRGGLRKCRRNYRPLLLHLRPKGSLCHAPAQSSFCIFWAGIASCILQFVHTLARKMMDFKGSISLTLGFQ